LTEISSSSSAQINELWNSKLISEVGLYTHSLALVADAFHYVRFALSSR
jgi:hypothetical protein